MPDTDTIEKDDDTLPPEESTDELERRSLASHINARPIATAQPEPTSGTADLEKNAALSQGMPISAGQEANPTPHSLPLRSGVASLWTKADNIQNPVLRVLGKIGAGAARAIDTAGMIAAPRIESAIPGTQGNAILQKRAQTTDTEESAKQAQEGATLEHTQALAADTEAQTNQRKSPQPKVGLTGEEGTLHDLMTGGKNGQPRMNPDTNQPYSYLEAFQKVQEAKAGAKPEKTTPAHVTYDSGIPVSVVGEDGKVFDVNDPKLPPALKPLVDAANRAHGQHVTEDANKQATAAANANSKQDKTEDFQMQEKGREHLQKVEDSYRDASEKADTLRNTVQAAKNGNMVAGSLQPLLAVLGVTTMEGVKRINNTELQNVQGAGSLWDQIKGKVGKLKEGQPMDADLQKNISDLADMLQKSAYTKYKGQHGSITKRYNLSDEEPVAGPGETQTTEPARPANVPTGYVYKENGPKGTGWYKP